MRLVEKDNGAPEFVPWLLSDFSAFSLLLSNLFVIYLAFAENLGIANVMLIYWMQSVIIGLFTAVKLLLMKVELPLQKQTFPIDATVAGVTASTAEFDSRKQKNDIGGFVLLGKIFLTGFFLVHYFGFHSGYLFFIFSLAHAPMTGLKTQVVDFISVGIAAAIFFGNHLFSFVKSYQKEKEIARKPMDFMQTFNEPYSRIVPMHLTIIIGFGFLSFFGSNALLVALFMCLKTYFDLKAHAKKHKASTQTTHF